MTEDSSQVSWDEVDSSTEHQDGRWMAADFKNPAFVIVVPPEVYDELAGMIDDPTPRDMPRLRELLENPTILEHLERDEPDPPPMAS